MAYIQNLEDEEQKKLAEGQLTSSAPTVVGGAAAPAGGLVANTAAPATGTGWTNLQSYLTANKGGVDGLADQVTGELNKGVDSFKGSVAADKNSTVAKLNDAAQDKAAEQVKSGLSSDPVRTASQASQFVNQGWGEQNAAEDYTRDLRQQGSQLNDRLAGTTDLNSQRANLGEINKGNSAYTTGFKNLDSFLLLSDPTAQAKLGATAARTAEVDSSLGDYTSTVGNAFNDARTRFDANKQAVANASRDAYGRINTQADARAAAAKKQARIDTDAALLAREREITKVGGYAATSAAGRDSWLGAGNANFGRDDVYTDAEIEALNQLANVGGLEQVTRGQDKAYAPDLSAWEKLVRGNLLPPPAPVAQPKAETDGSGKHEGPGAGFDEVAKVGQTAINKSKELATDPIGSSIKVGGNVSKGLKTGRWK